MESSADEPSLLTQDSPTADALGADGHMQVLPCKPLIRIGPWLGSRRLSSTAVEQGKVEDSITHDDMRTPLGCTASQPSTTNTRDYL